MKKSKEPQFLELILPTKEDIKSPKHGREAILAYVLQNHSEDVRLKTQTGIVDLVREVSGRSYSQSNISKAMDYFTENYVKIKGVRVSIKKNDNGFYELSPVDIVKEKKLHMLSDGLFSDRMVFFNNLYGPATTFAFKVYPEHADTAKERFYDLLGHHSIFDIIIHNDNLIILLNPEPTNRAQENSNILKNFVER